MIKKACMCALLSSTLILAQSPSKKSSGGERTREGGPEVEQLLRRKALTAHEVLTEMFAAIEKTWILEAYEGYGYMQFNADLNAKLPGNASGKGAVGGIDVDVEVQGKMTPSGKHALEIRGEFGAIDLVNDLRRRLVTSRAFKAFSDRPAPSRSANANLTNFRSYMLRYLGKIKSSMMGAGGFRSVYVGSGTHEGYDVDVIRVYRPPGKIAVDRRQPISLKRIWTFWQDGAYEIWVHRNTRLPAAVFYTNVDDQIYANFEFDYDRNWLPIRIVYNNNSVGSEGRGDLVLDFGEDRLLRGMSLNFSGDNGLELAFDATMFFEAEPPGGDVFRIAPPFGFKKVNHDHLKVLVLTQISGSLLKLKKHGVNLRNFKF